MTRTSILSRGARASGLLGLALSATATFCFAVSSPACAKGPTGPKAPKAPKAPKVPAVPAAPVGGAADPAASLEPTAPRPRPAAPAPRPTRDGRTLLFSQPSRFNGHVYVFQEGRDRVLRFAPRGARQSVARPDHPERLELLYTQGAVSALAAVSAPRRVLVIGLGGGSLPRFILHYFPRATVDAVDIDPVVAEAARRWFGLPPPGTPDGDRLRIHVADGRAFLESAAQARWDVIVLDAYGNASPPPALTTLEFLRTVRAHLAPGGVAVANVWVRRYNPLYDRMVATYSAAFGEVRAVEVPAGSDLLLVCGDRAAERSCGLGRHALVAASVRLGRRLALPFDLGALVRSGYHAPTPAPGARPLRDPASP